MQPTQAANKKGEIPAFNEAGEAKKSACVRDVTSRDAPVHV
jgi:hypothetical protein